MTETLKDNIETPETNKILEAFQKGITNNKLNTLQDQIVAQEKKQEVQQKSVDAMKKIGDVFKIQIPFLGDLGKLFGKKRPIDLLGSKEQREKNKTINGILKVFGFKSVEDIHSKYIEQQLTYVDKEFAINWFNLYKAKEQKTIPEDKSTRTLYGLDQVLTGSKDEAKATIKEKIPQDTEALKTSIHQLITEHPEKINPTVINTIDSSLISYDDQHKAIINYDALKTNSDAFVDKYLQTTIPLLINPDEAFITAETTTKESFVYALMGNLTGEKFFVEGVQLGLLPPPSTLQHPTQETGKQTPLEKKELKALTFEEAKTLASKVFGQGPATDLLCALSKNTPAMILRTVALGKHEGGLKFGLKNVDPNKRSKQINIGTFQMSAAKDEIVSKWNQNIESGKKLLKENNIPYEESYFKKITNYNEETWDNEIQKAQTDLLVRLGYIQSGRGGETTLNKLADANLSAPEIQKLMSTTIQGGIDAIGKDVVAQINTANTEQYKAIA